MARFEVPEGWTAQAYRFALDPSPDQMGMLESHCGAARFAFNHMLGVVSANLDQRKAERSYGIAEGDLTPSQGWSLAKLRKTWNAHKSVVAPWWQTNSKEAYNSGLDGLARALENWSTSRSGERAGTAVGFPKFKSKHRWARSVRFTTGAIRVEPDRHHVILPRIGRIRTHESTRKLARRLDAGTARILSATAWYGTELVTAPRFYPSTQLCSRCGAKAKLRLRDRIYHCRNGCPPIDRDLNAAINLARLGDPNHRETGTGTGSRPAASVTAGDGRGAIQKTSPTTTTVGTAGGDETSTPHANTGAETATPQGEAA